ncbi:hypothetical protein GJ496_003441 [Pomphorhynchus laevis]|nr:hypothetical protein GJ496_003441 [Pomphorhynchus laevis]
MTERKTLKAMILLAEGAEEIETIVVVDILRRASINVSVCAIGKQMIKCSRDVIIVGDCVLSEKCCPAADFDLVYMPGGLGGTKVLCDNKIVGSILEDFIKADKWICAMCAAPTVFIHHGNLLNDHKITSHPSVKEDMLKAGYSNYSEDRVVVDRKLITSRGPGTALEMALKIVEEIVGVEEAQEIAAAIVA